MILRFHLFCTFILAVLLVPSMPSYGQSVKIENPNPQVMEWKIGDTIRKALVYIPNGAKTNKTPIIFTFHGHGGNMENMYKTRRFDQLWPEAIFICPQGLNTVGQLTDPEGKLPGWQKGIGAYDDRDLKFFDAMLTSLQKNYHIDANRIYVTGHSNGGGFTYLLWAARGPIFAAVAPTAAVAAKVMKQLKPKPVLHLYGEKDELVKTQWQKATCQFLLRLNDCSDTGVPFADHAILYKSSIGTPVVIYSHPGGHGYPSAANQVIINFFKQQSK
jgi:polyhydroxybutyrate depolymerase